ncbi:MAG: pilus assembly protein FimV, partial [Cognaticolwellia sp.]
ALEDSINDQTDTSATNNQKVQDTAAEENNEISDPDDIDALLDSINDTDEDGSSEISDPDDIDALLDAINDTDEDGSSEISDPDATASNPATALASEDISNDDIATSAPSDNENIARINNFTDEYVQSFLGTDFSEQLNESADEAKVVEPQKSTNTESQTDTESQTENSTANNEEISDDFDIDTLIDEVNQTPEASDAPLDIGDDILDTTLFDKEFDNESDKEFDNEFDSELVSDLLSEKTENKAAEQASSATDEENLPASPGDFDESTLANLLNDEKDSDDRVELSADFTDSNVLADLLSGNDDTAPSAAKSTTKSNAEEVNGMKELDNLDFDDLLANIEEESSQPAGDNVEVNDDFDLGDDLDIGDDLETVKEDIALTKDNSDNKTVDKDFISVDSLLFNSLSDGEPSEPYEKMNIDVGLSEFPEFSGNVSEDDTDDDNGIAAKLDLAKVYLEMGDDDNAEVILLDVIKQGDAQQQFDAQQLLDKLKD